MTNKLKSLTKYKLIKDFVASGFSKTQADALYNALPHGQIKSRKRDFDKIIHEISLLRQEIIKLELRMIIKLGSILALALSLISIVIELS